MFLVIIKPDINQQTENNVSGIWYAGIVVFDKEYAFSQAGVESTRPVRYKVLIKLCILLKYQDFQRRFFLPKLQFDGLQSSTTKNNANL